MIDHYRKLYANYITRPNSDIPVIKNINSPQYITEQQFYQIQSISKDIISRSTYSLLPYYFLSADISTQLQDEFLSKKNMGNCVSFAHMIIDDLRDKDIHTGIIIPATLPTQFIQLGYPIFSHVAIMLETETNFIIFEPTYFIIEPIVIPKNGTDLRINITVLNTEWIYKYIDGSQTIIVTNLDGSELFYYKIAEIANPSESVSHPINAINKRITIVKFDPVINKKIAHLSIRIDTKKLESYNTSDGWYPRFDWSSISDNSDYNEICKSLLEWEGVSLTQCIAFGYEQIVLANMIIAIILENNKKCNDGTFSSDDEYSLHNW